MKTTQTQTYSLAIFCVFLFQLGFAQDVNTVIQKLKTELGTNPEPKRKAAIYSDLTWYYASVSKDSALHYGEKAIKSAQELNDQVLLAQVYSDVGAVHFRNNNFKNSEKNYLLSYGIRKKLNDTKGIAKLNNNLGSVYRNLSQFQKSIKMYLEAQNYFESIGDEENLNVTKANIGVIFKDLKNYGSSEKYLVEAIKYFEQKNNENRLCENYVNLGNTYQLNKEYDKAIKLYNKANEKCVKTGNTQAISYVSRNMASVYREKNNDSVSEKKLKESEIARKKFNSDLDLASLDIENATTLMQKGDAEAAEKKFHKLKGVFQKQHSPEDLLSVYKNLVTVKMYLNQTDSANYYYQKYIDENDKIFKLSVSKQTEELTLKYETEKKDKEILQNKNKIFKRNVTIFSLLGLFLAGAAIAFSLFRHRKKNEKIKIQKEILHQQDLATKAVMNAEDNERKRMATHLHDGVAQLLGAANMNVSALEDYKEDDEVFGKILNKTKTILEDAITDVRGLSHEIMPNMLIKTSLSNALRDLIEKSTSPKLHIHLKIEDLKDDLDQNIQVVLYRIIQECINNTSKHANATEINVFVKQTPSHIETVFSDNGKGFNPLKITSKSSGLGLENIKSRIAMMKGKLNIQSKEGEGTSIKVKIPIT